MTGFERGVRPIGVWSTSTMSFSSSTPSMASWEPTRFSQAPFARLTAAYITSCTSVDLPEPLTPVTQVSMFSGISTSMPFRLCSAAPRTRRAWLFGSRLRRAAGIGIARSPRRYFAVSDVVSRDRPSRSPA